MNMDQAVSVAIEGVRPWCFRITASILIWRTYDGALIAEKNAHHLLFDVCDAVTGK
jgi:hypothetical protein